MFDLIIPLTPDREEGVLSLQPLGPVIIQPAPIPDVLYQHKDMDHDTTQGSLGLTMLSTYMDSDEDSATSSTSSTSSYKTSYSQKQDDTQNNPNMTDLDVTQICRSIDQITTTSPTATPAMGIPTESSWTTPIEQQTMPESNYYQRDLITLDPYHPDISPISSCEEEEDDIFIIHPDEDIDSI